MPELIWEGKDAVINYHHSLPVRELKIDQHESLNPEPSLDDNLIIEGDNIEVLKSLIPKFASKIDVIYIDPPYNTGNENWVYNDNLNSPQIKSWLGNVVGKEDLQRHDKWLCMMYPRLVLMKQLLKLGGVLFISIDDNEAHHLRLILDEIFDNRNFIGEFIKQSKVGGGNDSKHIVKEHESCFCYTTNIEVLSDMYVHHTEEYLKRYKEEDDNGKFFWDTFARPGLKNPIFYEITAPDGTKINNGWIRSQDRFEKEYKEGIIRIIQKKDKSWSVQFKQYLNLDGKKPRSLSSDFGGTIEGKKDLFELFDNKVVFEYPKATKFLKTLLSFVASNDSLILDAFAGSGTTGHAVLEMNKEDGGNRKFILIQQPEESEEASKQGFKNIFEITTARIRRCIKGVETAKDPKLKEGLDGSFTVVKLGEALHLNTLFLEKNLPSYEALASYLFYHTTNQALSNVTENTSHYIGKTKNYKLYLIYSADKEKLKHPDYALSRSKLEQILKDCGNGYQALIYAVTIYVDNKSIKSLMEKEKYTKKPIICQIPYQYLQINSANVLNNLEDSED
jgi:adenine-specific DNA-methyltransferase